MSRRLGIIVIILPRGSRALSSVRPEGASFGPGLRFHFFEFLMKIAYMHFHLKTGGVTTVIRQQVNALKGICDTLVFSGQPPEPGFPCDVVPIRGLGYDGGGDQQPDPEQVAAVLIRGIHARWPTGCDILHVHNPTLAKNKNLIKILNILKKKGVRLFLQIHDFAEDGRSAAYFEDEYVTDSHYGVINSRDYRVLVKAGLDARGVHLVRNMVTPLPPADTTRPGRRHILYPIRAIRRKNIGEAILLARFFPDNLPLLITQPPNSPVDFPAYASWKQFAARHHLPVVFEAGRATDFPRLVHSAAGLLTTSISEGFGFAFLESWTADKFLWGRDLHEITSDFKKDGLRLNHLYTALRMPLTWIETDGFDHIWQKAVRTSWRKFGRSRVRFDLQAEFKRLTADGTIDFGLLNEQFQQRVVRKILSDSKARSEFLALNPFVAECGHFPDSLETIEKNRHLVQKEYSKKAYQKTLLAVYQAVLARKPVHAIDKCRLLDEFFRLDTFTLLKWGSYDS